MDPIRITGDMARVMRVAVRHGLIDAYGFIAARHPDGAGIFITPGSSQAGRFRRLTADQLIHVSSDEELDPGIHPAETALALEVLRMEPDAGAVMYGAPPKMMLLGAVGRDPEPLTHTNAELVHAGIARIDPDIGLGLDAVAARRMLRGTQSTPTRHIVGNGVLTVGHTPWEALRRMDALELMSTLTVERVRTGQLAPALSVADAKSIIAQRPFEEEPSRDPVRYYKSRDLGSEGKSLGDQWPGGTSPSSVEQARIALAVSSRILGAVGLVTFFEHISHRAPEYSDRFLMTNAHDFTAMEPGDVGTLRMEGDCEPIESRYPPAPFRWLHRDMFLSRPDVKAIVHTHPTHGRIEALTGSKAVGWHRTAVGTPNSLPTFAVPSLLFEEDHRRTLVGFLKEADAVHALHHGTDFVSSDLETATIRAIHHEKRCREDALAKEIGTPYPLSEAARRDLERFGPAPADWWDFYASALDPLTESDATLQPPQSTHRPHE